MKKILTILVIMLAISLTGCNVMNDTYSSNNEKSANDEGNTSTLDNSKNISTDDVIDNNNNYFVIVKGEKFKAGDKITDVSKVNLKLKDNDLTESIPSNRYLMGKSIIGSDEKTLFKLTPLNLTASSITVKDSVIGGFEVGENNYNKLSQETLALNLEIYGGIKLGSTYDDMVKAFGTEDYKYDHEYDEKYNSPAYTVYSYSKGYKKFEFIVDDSGKISQISWNNYSLNN